MPKYTSGIFAYMMFSMLTISFQLNSQCFAQSKAGDMSGIWEGTMGHANDPYSKSWQIIVTLEQNNSVVRGTTKLVAGDRWAVFSLTGRVLNNSLSTIEGAIVEQSSPTISWCMQRAMQLRLIGEDQLDGTWKSISDGCVPGIVSLVRISRPRNVNREDNTMFLSGQVVDNQTTIPIKASISCTGQNTRKQTVSTSADGEYSLKVDKDETYVFTISADGYETSRVEIKPVKPMQNFFLNKKNTVTNSNPLSIPTPIFEPATIQINQPVILNNVLFQTSSSSLLPIAYPELDKITDLMLAKPSMKIRLEGHTDKIGDASENLKLSKERVAEVKSYLLKKGVSKDRITTIGYGDTKPICRPECDKNKRVEFVITEQ